MSTYEFFSADDGGVSGAQADGNSQAMNSFSKNSVKVFR
jgi:hypothetical protein